MSRERCTDYRDRLVALAENPLGPEAEPGLLAHLEACPLCEAEYHWLTSLCREMEAIGEAQLQGAPNVDLTDGVMKAVARHKQADPRLVSLDSARTRRFSRFVWMAASTAAAATIVVGLWLTGYRITRQDGPTTALRTNGSGSNPAALPGQSNLLAGTPDSISGDSPENELQNLIDNMRPFSAPTADLSADRLASLTINDVLAARKEAISDPAAREEINRWANLAAEKARELAAAQELSLEAKVGAAQNLPPEEAERILLAAVQADPENPYLRYALGNVYSQQAGMADKAAAEYAAQAELDPENALAYYQLAASLLAQGDPENAAGALETARSLGTAHPYTIEAADNQTQALIQSGVAEDVARILTALTAGTGEYGDLVALSAQLLDYGKYYEQNGQIELAQQICDSVRVLGTQVTENASFSNEQLAGLDIQRAAIEALSEFMQFMQSPQNVQTLADQTRQLSSSLSSVGGFFNALNAFFDAQPSTDIMSIFADYVLGNGDLDVLDFLANIANHR